MSVEISWQQPKRVIYERFYDAVTVEELTSIQQTFFQFLIDGDAPVHSIIDLSAVRSYPKSINQVRQAFVADKTGKGGRVVLIVGSNVIMRFITSMVSQIAFKDAQFTFCNSVDEALAYLRQIDSSVTLEQIDG
ncbi:MAG: hypothetical protein GC204_14455 [Chloroflexi bacterium]|nr:hypothetical protein [Chloroflexota bacterium]